MAKSKIIGVRIPDHLLREIENFGLTNFPKNESFDMTKSLLFLIQRGLQSEGIESPKNPAPPVIDSSIARELLENYLKANKALNFAELEGIKETITALTNEMAQLKSHLIKNSTGDCFDAEIIE